MAADDGGPPFGADDPSIRITYGSVMLAFDCGDAFWFLICTDQPTGIAGETVRKPARWLVLPRSGAFTTLFGMMEAMLPGGAQCPPSDDKPRSLN